MPGGARTLRALRAGPARAARPPAPAEEADTAYSQPFSRAIRTASARLRTASFWIAVER